MDPLLTASGLDLARRIRDGELTSRTVLEAHLAQVERSNPPLNALVARRYEAARAECDAADELLRGSDAPDTLPPFHGVPCSVKESIALAGMPYTSGLKAREGVVATEDAPAVANLRRAGAIPIGVTNISELCMWMESSNTVYGRTGNPYDPERTAGGSSGGEGALVGAGGTPFGLGADVGGSIRMPAFFNGVFGHKPTGGLIPVEGHFPLSQGDARRYLTLGPLCRRAEDLWPLVRALAAPPGRDFTDREIVLGDPDDVDLSSLTVLHIPDNGRMSVSRDIARALARAADALRRRGAHVIETRIPGLAKSLEIWGSMLGSANEVSFGTHLAEGGRFHHARELARWLVGRSPHTFPAIALAIIEDSLGHLGGMIDRFAREGEALRRELVDRLGPDGIMLYPPYPSTAPRHGVPLLTPYKWVYTAILNVMELPVTQVPTGLAPDGLPTGVQVGAVHGNDHLTIAVARALEEELGGWVPPAPGVR